MTSIDSPTPQAGTNWRSPVTLVLTALVLGIAVEVLFDDRPIGVSAVIWAGLCIACTLAMAAAERVRPSPDGLWLVPPIVFFAGMLALRVEPMTVTLAVVLVLALLALWVRTFRAGGLRRGGWLGLRVAVVWG